MDRRSYPLHFLLLLLSASIFIACDPVVDSNPPIEVDPTAESIRMPGAQVPSLNGVISVDRIVSREQGWLALVADNGSGAPGSTILGQRAIDSGTTTSLQVGLVSAVDNGERIWAVLYRDAGQIGVFEPTGADQRASGSNGLDVVSSTYIRWYAVEDQILVDNQVTLDTVRSAGPVWMEIFASDLSGNPTVGIGRQHFSGGTVAGMKILLDTSARRAVIDGDRLWLIMHSDRGTVGSFEPGIDLPYSFVGRPVSQRFRIGAAAAPAVQISSQSISSGSVVVQRVDATKVGWIVIRETGSNGAPTMSGSIGRARVHTGVNTQVTVPLSKQVGAGTKLWAMLHEDTGSLGRFEYTASGVVDVPILVGGQAVVTGFTVQ